MRKDQHQLNCIKICLKTPFKICRLGVDKYRQSPLPAKPECKKWFDKTPFNTFLWVQSGGSGLIKKPPLGHRTRPTYAVGCWRFIQLVLQTAKTLKICKDC